LTEQMLSMTGVRKEFPGVIAVDNVDFSAERGEVMGLLGENGAGKSTLMNLLYGLYRMDAGSISIDGTPVRIGSSHDAIKAGLGMVHQAFALVPNLTVRENIVLGSEPARVGVLEREEASNRVANLIEKAGLPINQDEVVENLPTGFKQRVEILKALYRGAKVLILDEPTAVLTPLETDELFKSIRRLTESGTTVVFITHKLKEVMAITNRITVMRRGKIVGVLDTKDATFDRLASMMVGRQVERKFKFNEYKPGEVLLEVQDVVINGKTKQNAVNHCSLEVREGEIVGLAGVEGNGQSELVQGLMGLQKAVSGTIRIRGRDTARMSPAGIIGLAVGHIPEDRALSGLVLDFTVADNTVLGSVKKKEFSRGGVLAVGRVREFARRVVRAFNVSTPSIDVKASSLSGGNQQKVIVGREISSAPHLLIAHQPTRGLDVASTEYIQSLLVESRNEGKGVLLISADFDEILDLSDRILVLYEGRVIGELKRGAGIRELGKLLGGISA
jgi:general nucleoside transport system ATP-binding protein